MAVQLAKRWLYRSWQFFAAVGFGGKASRADLSEARRVLGPSLFYIFAALPAPYQRHGISVYKKVLAGGGTDVRLLQAALLHDSGKSDPESGRQVTLGHRVAVVLLETAPLGRLLLVRLSNGSEVPCGFRGRLLYPFYLSRHHPGLGAQRARQHGASPEVVRLIAEHQAHRSDDEALRRLQAADSRS